LQSYELTTAEPELGVVVARAADAPPGINMVPLSWHEMQCPVTLAKEFRKVTVYIHLILFVNLQFNKYCLFQVAKVVPDNLHELAEEKANKGDPKVVPCR
jgi:hypothetical protein